MVNVVLQVPETVGLNECDHVVRLRRLLLIFVAAKLVDVPDRQAGIRQGGIASSLLPVVDHVVLVVQRRVHDRVRDVAGGRGTPLPD